MIEQLKKLSDYVKEQTGDGRFALFSVFGEETEGNFLKWVFGLQRFDHFSSEGRHISVYVPRTEKGAEPLCEDSQPYIWDGKINVDAAETAIWHAFEILTESEAKEFREEHSPVVIFEFMQNFTSNTLRVKYIDGAWRLIDE